MITFLFSELKVLRNDCQGFAQPTVERNTTQNPQESQNLAGFEQMIATS